MKRYERTWPAFILPAGVILMTGVISGCVTGRANAPDFAEEQVVNEEADTADVISTVTEEGPVRRTTVCPPLAETTRPQAPSVEIGIAAPVAPVPGEAPAAGPTFYSRYECH